MKPRSLARVLTLPKAKRIEVLAEGLRMLAEHVGVLYADLLELADCDRRRGAAVVDAIASEEAAKLLIVLDVIRLGWDDQDLVGRQFRRFYNHLARGMYAWLVRGRPADFKEVCDYAEHLRRSHYLDGPSEVDWIFRNEILAEREDSIYVDYVAAEEECFWITPAVRVDDFPVAPSMIIELAIALDQVGAISISGLDVVARAWQGVVLTAGTHWQVVEGINRNVVDELNASGLIKAGITPRQVQLVHEQWTFPLGNVNLEVLDIDPSTLREQRDRWLANYY